MIKPTTGHEFCTIGAGYKIHIRSIGSNKAKCGSNGRRTLASRVSAANANRSLDAGQWQMCQACVAHTTEVN